MLLPKESVVTVPLSPPILRFPATQSEQSIAYICGRIDWDRMILARYNFVVPDVNSMLSPRELTLLLEWQSLTPHLELITWPSYFAIPLWDWDTSTQMRYQRFMQLMHLTMKFRGTIDAHRERFEKHAQMVPRPRCLKPCTHPVQSADGSTQPCAFRCPNFLDGDKHDGACVCGPLELHKSSLLVAFASPSVPAPVLSLIHI